MFLRSRRSSRSVDYLLAALSPLEVAKSTRAYLAGLPEDELHQLVERSVARMNDEERAYFEMSPDFATFLEQNRRALRTLDHEALRAILLPVIVARSAQVEGTEDESLQIDELSASLRAALPPLSPATAWHRLTTPIVRRGQMTRDAILAADLALARAYRAIAFAPVRASRAVWSGILTIDRALASVYRRAWPVVIRGAASIATGLAVVAAGAAIAALLVGVVVPGARSAVAWVQTHPVPRIAVARAAHSAPAPPVRVARAPKPRVVHHTIARVSTPKPSTPKPRPTAAPTPRPRPTATPAPVHVAKAPAREHRAKRIALAKRPAGASIKGTLPSHDAPLIQRARLIVMSYLDSLMRGDASSALGNLGLSASAGTSNLTEAPILAGATEFRIVHAALMDSSNAKVQVMIESPQGRFFGDYLVSANGPAAWITQHEVVPAGSTVARHR